MNKQLKDIAYMDIFKKAFDLTWKNKALWWFGLFLALGGGMGNFNYTLDEKNKKAGAEISQFISNHMEMVIAGAILIGIICLGLLILSVIARAGAILSIEEALKNKSFEFRSGMREGKKYFGKLFILYLVLGALMIASLIVLITPIVFLFVAKNYILGSILAVIAFFIFIPLVVLVSYFKTYGEIYIVSGKLSSMGAIEASYDLFLKNLSTSLVMGLLFIPIGMIMMIGIIIAVSPLAILIFIIAFLGKTGMIIAIVLGLISFLIILLVQSVFQVFHQTAWIIFFREIATPPAEEKIEETTEETVKDILPAASEGVKMTENEK